MQAACELHQEAIEALEREGRAGASGDVFRQAVGALLRLGRSAEAVGLLLRWAAAAGEAGLHASQAKAYVGAVVVWLHAGDARQADAVYQARASLATISDGDRPDACASLCKAPIGANACHNGDAHAQDALISESTVHAQTRWVRLAPCMALCAVCCMPALSVYRQEKCARAQDAINVANFARSEQAAAGGALLDAYRSGSADSVRQCASGPLLCDLDNQARPSLLLSVGLGLGLLRIWAVVLQPGQPGAAPHFSATWFMF